MPESDPLVRKPAIDFIIGKAHKITKNILDVGVGSGFYGRTLKAICPQVDIYGIEIWPSYIQPMHLEWYKAVMLSNALTFNYELLKDSISLIIAADVVEHFEKKDAVSLIETWKKYAPWIVITLPIQRYEQGPYMGNVYETHLHHWTVQEVESDLEFKLIKDCGTCGLFSWEK